MRRLLFLILTLLITLVGCINNTEISPQEECEQKIQDLLYTRKYNEIIDIINNECSLYLSEEKKNLYIGHAYLGKAGLTPADFAKDVEDAINIALDTGDMSKGLMG